MENNDLLPRRIGRPPKAPDWTTPLEKSVFGPLEAEIGRPLYTSERQAIMRRYYANERRKARRKLRLPPVKAADLAAVAHAARLARFLDPTVNPRSRRRALTRIKATDLV